MELQARGDADENTGILFYAVVLFGIYEGVQVWLQKRQMIQSH